MFKPKLVAIAIVVAAAAAGSAAFAAIPDGSGVVHGCYGKPGSARPGQLRVVDSPSESCSSVESSLDWSQTGPPGLPGPKGDKGDTGDPGLTGVSADPDGYLKRAPLYSDIPLPAAAGQQVLAGSLALPAGNFLVSVEGQAGAISDPLSVHCLLYENGKGDTLLDQQTEAASHDTWESGIAMTDVVGSSSPFTVDVYCDSKGADDNFVIVNLTATNVGTVHSQ